MLALLARKSTEVVGDWCAIYLLDDAGRQLKLEAVHHAHLDELRSIRRMLAKRPIQLGDGPIGTVAAEGEARLLSSEAITGFIAGAQDLAESVEELALLRRVAPSSAIAASIRARGRSLGVLVAMETHTKRQLGSSELALLTELGDRAGMAILNSQLFEESQAQRKHLEAVISQMVDGVVIANAAGATVIVNEAARTMLTPVKQGGEDAHAASSGQIVPPLIQRALAGELLAREEILVGGEPGGKVLSATATPIREESGQIQGAVVVMRDVTKEREVERMKDEFVATVSHELRTPITTVLGYTDILLRGVRGALAPPQLDALQSVRGAGSRLLDLINDLLDISRLEAGRQDLTQEAVDLPAAIERALSAVAVAAARRKVRLLKSVPRSLPPAFADDGQLQRILANLLSNALKFTPEGGTVSVSARPFTPKEFGDRAPSLALGRPPELAVTIADTGVGIPSDRTERIWDKFQQGDSSSRRAHGGTGLGLAITRGLVELHGGTVWVESEGVPGKGSTFGFTLPVAQV